MLRHVHERTFLYKESPRCDRRWRRKDEHVVHAQLEVGNLKVCGSTMRHPWFNCGSGGSPVRLNRLPHGFTPASFRSLCAIDKESLRKALHNCVRALGTGQGADAPAAPALHAAPRAVNLADKFSLKEEVVVHNTCNLETTLAPETPGWRWLGHLIPGYVFRRAMTLWMKKNCQEDKNEVQSYPWETGCLSAGDFSKWKVLRAGLSSNPHSHMPSTNPVWMPCSLHGPLPVAVLPGARPVWHAFRGTGRCSQRRTWPMLLLGGPGGFVIKWIRQNGGPAVHADDEQRAGNGRHHLRWGKAQEGQGKCRNDSSGANGNGTVSISAA